MDQEELEWLKEFIDENKNLIKNQEYKQLYTDAYNTADNANDYSLVGNLTYVLYKSGINPLYKMDIVIEMFAEFTDITEYTVPSNIGAIDNSAFAHCSNLEKIHLVGGNLTLIGEGSFKHCGKLDNVEIPKGVKTISKYAFSNCEKLKTIHLPDTLETIENFAFAVSPIKDIHYSGTKEQWKKIKKNAGWVHSTLQPGYDITVHCTDGDFTF